MRLDVHSNGLFLVTLSRRNLLALLAKLDQPNSTRTILGGYVYVDGKLADLVLALRAEPDEQHYANREPAGRMLETTEAAIRWAQLRSQPDDA